MEQYSNICHRILLFKLLYFVAKYMGNVFLSCMRDVANHAPTLTRQTNCIVINTAANTSNLAKYMTGLFGGYKRDKIRKFKL